MARQSEVLVTQINFLLRQVIVICRKFASFSNAADELYSFLFILVAFGSCYLQMEKPKEMLRILGGAF